MPYLSNPNPSSSKAQAGTYLTSSGTNWGSLTVSNTATISTGAVSAAKSAKVTYASGNVKAERPPAPPGWTTIKLKPNDAILERDEIHLSPVNGTAAYFARLTISNQAARHHWDLFRRLHPDVDFLMVGVAEEETAGMYMSTSVSNVVFPKKEDFDLFERWLDGYLDVFDGDIETLYTHRLPPPPRTMNYSVQVHMKQHSSLVDLAVWMMEHCNDRAYYLGGMLFFLNDEDAVLYQMKFK